MTKQQILNLEGTFYWGYKAEYFIRTRKGSFIWSCPSLIGGTNTLKSYPKKREDWHKECDILTSRKIKVDLIGNVTTHEVIYKEQTV
jgi:hypothetical protein